MTATAASDPVAERAAELLIGGSLEMSPERVSDAEQIAALLPAGTRVYLHHLPRLGLHHSLAAIRRLRAAGLEPVPHVAARRITGRAELVAFLAAAVAEGGVSKVLLIGGDDAQPLGPYADAIALLRDEALGGLREIGLPGYPEGHPRIPQVVLDQALTSKLALAREQGLAPSIVTQFSFAPARVVEYCSELARHLPDVPVQVGMAAPTDAATLLRFAQRCGVSASLRAMGAQGMGAVRLFMHTDPSEQLSAVAQYCVRHADCNVVGAHLFSFGAAVKAAAWMNRLITARSASA